MHEADDLSEITVTSLYLASSPMYPKNREQSIFAKNACSFNILEDSRLLEVS